MYSNVCYHHPGWWGKTVPKDAALLISVIINGSLIALAILLLVLLFGSFFFRANSLLMRYGVSLFLIPTHWDRAKAMPLAAMSSSFCKERRKERQSGKKEREGSAWREKRKEKRKEIWGKVRKKNNVNLLDSLSFALFWKVFKSFRVSLSSQAAAELETPLLPRYTL